MNEAWKDRGACVSAKDPELWFPEGLTDKYLPQIEQAKAVCRTCPVRGECLSYADENGVKDGIWGGMTTYERANAARRRKRRVAKVVAL